MLLRFYQSVNFVFRISNRILFFVDNIINGDRLSFVCEDLYLFLILFIFENALSAVQLAIGIVRFILMNVTKNINEIIFSHPFKHYDYIIAIKFWF